MGFVKTEGLDLKHKQNVSSAKRDRHQPSSRQQNDRMIGRETGKCEFCQTVGFSPVLIILFKYRISLPLKRDRCRQPSCQQGDMWPFLTTNAFYNMLILTLCIII